MVAHQAAVTVDAHSVMSCMQAHFPDGFPHYTWVLFTLSTCTSCESLVCFAWPYNFHLHHHLSLNRKGRWGTTDDLTNSFLHFSLFSTALWELADSRPVHSLMLSSHLFLCLPCLRPPFSVPCKMVLPRPEERETWPYHCSLHLFTMVRRPSCGPIACWIFTQVKPPGMLITQRRSY